MLILRKNREYRSIVAENIGYMIHTRNHKELCLLFKYGKGENEFKDTIIFYGIDIRVIMNVFIHIGFEDTVEQLK